MFRFTIRDLLWVFAQFVTYAWTWNWPHDLFALHAAA